MDAARRKRKRRKNKFKIENRIEGKGILGERNLHNLFKSIKLTSKMKNKNVGFLIVGIAVVIGIIVLIFNLGLKSIVGLTCTHGPSCSMYDTISIQTYVSLAIAALVLVIGLFLIFSKEDKEIVFKKIKEKVEIKRKPVDYSKLDKEEKVLVKIVEENDGSIFQADLIEKSGFDKVKVSRILDRLEGRQLIERKRRGMTNVVLLK